MTPAQTDQLVSTMANASSSYQAGGKATPGSIDWNQVATQAAGYLNPQQLAMIQYQTQLAKLGTLMAKFRATSHPPSP